MNKKSSLYQELNKEEIINIIKKWFHTDILQEYFLLKGGLFNTTYKIIYGEERKEAVLRAAPINRHLLLEFEENLMEAEYVFCEYCKKKQIPTSNILVCDTTKQIIDRDFMIAEYIPSISLSDLSIPEEQKKKLYYEVGCYVKKMHEITKKNFGRLSREVKGETWKSWYEYSIYEIENVLKGFRARQEKKKLYGEAFSKDEEKILIKTFEKYKSILDTTTVSHLLHTDLWEGNVLVSQIEEEYKVAGIIDGDRAIWGDVDYDLYSPWMINEDFLRGYGMQKEKNVLSDSDREKKKKLYYLWYDLINSYVYYAEYNEEKLFRSHKTEVMRLASML